MDVHNQNHEFYTISNIYYDTEDSYLIRHSLSKPDYKEKLRLRAYGVPKSTTKVFLEIKKKYRGLVNKRRTSIVLDNAYSFVKEPFGLEDDCINRQVLSEIRYFLKVYDLKPQVYIAYDRLAFFERDNNDLRISFDKNIRTRRYNLKLEAGDYGERLLDNDTYLMEIKTSRAMPLWLTDMLTRLNIKKSSFSKYGTEYKAMVNGNTACYDKVV
jgi:hypothetical protein